MRFKCPHCKHWIDTPPGHASKKANAARKRNAKLAAPFAGRKPATPEDALEHVFLSKPGDAEPWTGEAFLRAVDKATGYQYSRSRGFALLQKLKRKYKDIARWKKRHAGKADAVKFVGGLDKAVPSPADSDTLKKNFTRASR